MMTEEGSAKNVNIINPGTRLLALGCGHISHIVKIHYLLLYQYTAH